MKNFTSVLFLVVVVSCTKPRSSCSFPTFSCLQGNWIEKEHTDTPGQIKEYIQVYVDHNRQILYDWTFIAQANSSQVAIGEYYFAELPQEDSVALSPVYPVPPFHRYLKMISENEIEIDYMMPPGPPQFKKRYTRE